ncbi:radical SAM protein [Butyrivibrio sp. VCB2001]|uniref:radical SAM protein n=1 Tax=Butyrivibrio sp. VCB2001 TaxID=1280667 RepID=UPI00040E879E|nr:radical SAM protein [Butyrivibrio sp. VCB2001]
MKSGINCSERIVMVGPPYESQRIENLMLRAGCQIDVVAYCEDTRSHHMIHELSGKKVWSYQKAIDAYLNNEIDALFIDSLSFADDVKLDNLVEWFGRKGVDKLYVPPAVEFKKPYFDDIDILFNLERQKYRTHVQLMVTNQCNMGCMYCSHYIPLAKTVEIYTVEQIKKDLSRLSELSVYLDEIHLFGGEPFLHPDLPGVISACREIYPNTQIRICSNGMLIERQTKELLELLGRERVLLAITQYKPMEGRTDEMIDTLNCHHIRFFINPESNMFYKKFTLTPQDIEKAVMCCPEKFATHMFNGMISRCHFPTAARYFNERFTDRKFDVESSFMDIHKNTAEEIFAFLRTPKESCKYCMDKTEWVPWRRCTEADKNNPNGWVI